MRVWVTEETIVDGKRKRSKCGPGVRGIGNGDRFVVAYFDPSGRRRREKVGRSGEGDRIGNESVRKSRKAVEAGSGERGRPRGRNARNMAEWNWPAMMARRSAEWMIRRNYGRIQDLNLHRVNPH